MPARHRHILAIILLLYTGISLWYSFVVPPGEGVDEAAHLDYVLFLKDQHRLPVQNLPAQNLNETRLEVLMGHHPPLYYALSALIIASIDTQDRANVLRPNPHFMWDESGLYGWTVTLHEPGMHALSSATLLALQILRFMGIIMGAAGLICIYLAIQTLYPAHFWPALGGTALVALNPAYLYMASTVHHDVLLAALGAAIAFWCVYYSSNPIPLRSLFVIAFLLGAAIMTKVSGVVFVAVVALVIITKQPLSAGLRKPLFQVGWIGITILAVAGWWFVRNLIVYGDPLGMTVYMDIFQSNIRNAPFTWWLFANDFLAQLGRTFWGAFGFMHILLPRWTRISLWALTLFALLGWLPILAGHINQRAFSRAKLVAWGALLLLFLLIFAFYARVAGFTMGAGHGRYLLPAAASIGALAIRGLNGYGNWRYQRAWSLGILLAMVLYASIIPAHYVWPHYAPAPVVTPEEVAQATPVDAQFTNGVKLVAATSPGAIVIPGQGFSITTYWAFDDSINRQNEQTDIYVHMSIISENNEQIAFSAFWPEISSIPAVWQDRIVENTQSFYIPPEQPGGMLTVQIEATNSKGGEPVRLVDTSATHFTLFELLILGAVVEITEENLPRQARREIFAGQIQLVAAPLPQTITAGEYLPIELYWQVLAPVSEDYTIFLHVLDENAQMIAQLDRPPGGGTSPTSAWQPGKLLRDTYPISLPELLPPGDYHVQMGIYTWPELIRQPITLDGAPIGDSLHLGQVTVLPPQ